MAKYHYQIRRCESRDCGLRYPLLKDNPFGTTCPRCSSTTILVDTIFLEDEPAVQAGHTNNPWLGVLLDNVRSAWNVGSIFRTSDGVGIQRLYLCGITPTPKNPLVLKTSLGAEKNIPWQHDTDGVQVALTLKDQGKKLWAMELGENSESLYDHLDKTIDEPIVLVFGNEMIGIDPGILEHCERMISLPMYGGKRSLNVAVAFGIVSFTMRYIADT
jgi:tRNA G18 (ribose-2'-O)-methylase SpoU